jgi:hypothetical protein
MTGRELPDKNGVLSDSSKINTRRRGFSFGGDFSPTTMLNLLNLLNYLSEPLL